MSEQKTAEAQEREAFEAWAIDAKLAYRSEQMGVRFFAIGDGYPSWRAWQAARALPPKPDRPMLSDDRITDVLAALPIASFDDAFEMIRACIRADREGQSS